MEFEIKKKEEDGHMRSYMN